MKSERGITIVSLMVYIVVLSVVIGTVSMLIKYFYKNQKETVIEKNTASQYSRFVAYITDDINSEKIRQTENSIKVVEDSKTVEFDEIDGKMHRYTFRDSKIYYQIYTVSNLIERKSKNIELCDNVEDVEFNYSAESKTLTTKVKIDGTVYNNKFIVK